MMTNKIDKMKNKMNKQNEKQNSYSYDVENNVTHFCSFFLFIKIC